MFENESEKMSKIRIVELIQEKYKVKLKYPYMRSKKELIEILTKLDNKDPDLTITTENRVFHF